VPSGHGPQRVRVTAGMGVWGWGGGGGAGGGRPPGAASGGRGGLSMGLYESHEDTSWLVGGGGLFFWYRLSAPQTSFQFYFVLFY